MPQRYEPTGDVEVLLEALKRHAEKDKYSSLAAEEKELESREEAQQVSKRDLEYKTRQVTETKEKVAKARRKVAHIINTLGKLGCPEELIQTQWRDYDKKFVLPWPNGHDLAAWIKNDTV